MYYLSNHQSASRPPINASSNETSSNPIDTSSVYQPIVPDRLNRSYDNMPTLVNNNNDPASLYYISANSPNNIYLGNSSSLAGLINRNNSSNVAFINNNSRNFTANNSENFDDDPPNYYEAVLGKANHSSTRTNGVTLSSPLNPDASSTVITTVSSNISGPNVSQENHISQSLNPSSLLETPEVETNESICEAHMVIGNNSSSSSSRRSQSLEMNLSDSLNDNADTNSTSTNNFNDNRIRIKKKARFNLNLTNHNYYLNENENNNNSSESGDDDGANRNESRRNKSYSYRLASRQNRQQRASERNINLPGGQSTDV